MWNVKKAELTETKRGTVLQSWGMRKWGELSALGADFQSWDENALGNLMYIW